MIDLLLKLVLIPIGVMLVWSSDSTARQLVQSKRVPKWMPVGMVRNIYVVGGILSIIGALKLLFWP